MSIQTTRKITSRVWRVINTTAICTHAEGDYKAFKMCGAPAIIEREVQLRYVNGREETVRSYFCRSHGEARQAYQHELPIRNLVAERAAVHNVEGRVHVIGHKLCMVRMTAPDNTLVACALFDASLSQGERVRVQRTLDGRQKATRL